jgi:hypothetical protein
LAAAGINLAVLFLYHIERTEINRFRREFMSEENKTGENENWVRNCSQFASSALLGGFSALLISIGVHFYIIMQGQQAGLAFFVTIPYSIVVVLPSGAIGGTVGSNYWQKSGMGSIPGALLGGVIAAIIAYACGTAYLMLDTP